MIAPDTVVPENNEGPTMFDALTCALIAEPHSIEKGYTIRAEIGM
jgi:hypothetical protein